MSVALEDLFPRQRVLGGGITTAEIADFSNEEEEKFNEFINDAVAYLRAISPVIASDFERQREFFHGLARIFKAKVNRPYGGVLPSANQFGSQLLIPYFIKWTSSPSSSNPCYSDYTVNSWDLSLTAGTDAYLLGSSANFYKASPTVGSRVIFGIMENGIVEVGTSPKLNQFKVDTERASYPPFAVHPLVDQSVERNLTIYRYNLSFSLPVFYDFGVKLKAMPIASGTSNVRLIGVAFYEPSFFSDTSYAT